MNPQVRAALHGDLTIDLTTTGRHSGAPRRIEIWLLSVDGRLFITGTPGPRGWYANLLHDPACVVHLKQKVVADLDATATPITDPVLRQEVLMSPEAGWYRVQGDDLDVLLAEAPLVELTIT